MERAKGYLSVGRFWTVVAVSFAIWLLVGVGCLFFGQVRLLPRLVLNVLSGGRAAPQDVNIVLEQRLPRVLLGLLAGGALAAAGAVFQALLRNPLATPHTLGVSAGAALGAVVAISLDWTGPRLGPLSPVQFFALVGALLSVGIVYALARRKEVFSPMKLLLAGVTLGLISSAMIMFVRFISDPQKLVIVDRWLMGGLDVQGYRSIASVLPILLPAVVLLFTEAGAMNQLALGEEIAVGRGVDVPAVRLEAFLGGSVLAAAVVSVAGPIGFVGLIIPHALRAVFGPDHRLLLFLCFFGGGAFLAVADTFARSAFAPSELPVGVLTAMLGGPFFLILLVASGRQR